MIRTITSIEGLDKLSANLSKIDGKEAIKIVRKSLREGAKIFQRAARAATPIASGQLVRNLKVKASSKKGRVNVSVGFGSKWYTGEQFYAAFVEFGHRAGSRKLGDQRKFVEGEHMLQNSFEETKDLATSTIIKTVAMLIESLNAGAEGESE